MKISSIIKSPKFKIAFVVFSTTSALISYLPIYGKNRIVKEIEERGFKATIGNCELAYMGIKCSNVNIYNENYDTSFNKLSIMLASNKDVHVQIDDGYANIVYNPSIKLDNSHKKISGSTYNIIVDASNIKTLVKYQGIEAKFNIDNGSVSKNEKMVDISRINIKHPKAVVTIDSGNYKNGEIILGNIDAEQITFSGISEDKDSGIPKTITKDKILLIPKISYTSASFNFNDYKLISKDGVYEDHSIASKEFEIIRNGKKYVTLENSKIKYKENKLQIVTDRIKGHNDKISKSDLELDKVSFSINKDSDIYKYEVKINNIYNTGKIKVNGQAVEIITDLVKHKCQDVIDAMPINMKDSLVGFIFDGDISGSILVNTELPSADINLKYSCNPVKIPGDFSRNTILNKFKRVVHDKDNNEKEEITGPNTPEWTSLVNISSYMPLAVMGTEDSAFLKHNGILINAIENSIIENIKAKKFIRGGSTISMQTAKNLWLNRQKTISRKFQEAFLTMHLEKSFSKNEIMEIYLNIIEFSPGEYGIKNAARRYFGVSPSALSLSQSIFLASLLPNPKSASWTNTGKVSESKMRFIRLVINNLRKLNFISDEEEREGLNEWVVIGQSEPDLIERPEFVPDEVQVNE